MSNILTEYEEIKRELEELDRDTAGYDQLDQELARKCEEDFYTFICASWQYAGTRDALKPCWYVDVLAEHLVALYKRQIRNLLISIAPRHGKCQDEDDMIWMADQGLKPISFLEVGDKILSYNFDDGYVENDEIVAIENTGLKKVIEFETETRFRKANNTIRVTSEHRLLAKKKGRVDYIKAASLQNGDYILEANVDGNVKWARIVSRKLYGEKKTRDIQVKKNENYISDGLVSHNSTICAVQFPSWIWLNDPAHQFLTGSYGAHLAKRDNRAMKRLVSSNWYRQHWGHLFNLMRDSQAVTSFENDQGGKRVCTSVDGLGTGEGSDIQIIDDPHKANERGNINQLNKVYIDWFEETLKTRYNNPDTFCRLVIHQRIDALDLTGRLLKEEDQSFERLILQEEFEPDQRYYTSLGWTDPRIYKGELLAPEIFNPNTSKVAAEIKANKSLWECQYQQNPPEEGRLGVIEKQHLHDYDPLDFIQKYYFDYYLTSWDLADGENIDSKYIVGQLWGMRFQNNCKFLIWQERKIMPFQDQVQAFLNINRKYPINIHKHLVEHKQTGAAFVNTLERNHNIKNLELIKVEKNKMGRFLDVSPEFTEHRIYRPSKNIPGYQWVEEWDKELTKFPLTDYSDQVDSTSQALAYLMTLDGLSNTQQRDDNVENYMDMKNIILPNEIFGKEEIPEVETVKDLFMRF